MPQNYRLLLYPLLFIGGVALAGAALLGIVFLLAYPRLPSIEAITDYRPRIPLRVLTADGKLIGEFGEEKRDFVLIAEVPELMKKAILAAEDDRFYEHSGVDTLGVLRAAVANATGGGKKQGASTITMQVARNFFLSSEKTVTRKLYEALLALKIEHSLTKDEILQLYVNQIYLGQHAYGFAAAAQSYFGKPLKDVTLAEAAMLAGLPKAPSAFNPVVNPKRAKLRQNYVLTRMRALGFISQPQLTQAQGEALRVKHTANDYGIHAEHVAEMARQIAYERFQERAYNDGLRVVTTINSVEQEAAYKSLRRGVLDYDRRHGYRGAERYVDMAGVESDSDDALEDLLQDIDAADDLLPAIVLNATPQKLRAYLRGGELITLTDEGLKFAKPMLDSKAPPNKQLRRGAVIRVQKNEKGWQIAQLPEVEAAFVAADPADGGIRALIGGFDFNRNKFNHVTQAWRQPGSSFKPFIYSAALEKGFTPASVFNDAPIVVSAGETGSRAWEPHNYDGKYEGPMTMRTALMKSKNMVSIRILQSIGAKYAQDYATRFGFDAEKHPPYLTMALGAGSVTPWQHLAAYSVFANGGYRVEPFIVKQITDAQGNVLAAPSPSHAGDETQRVIDPRNAWLMDSMLREVTRRGTGARADATLKRHDLAGKTGTTNEYVDAWFCGYQPTVIGIAWIGFDQPRTLGKGETGGSAALPIWIGYMETALKSVPEMAAAEPPGIVNINNDFAYSESAREAQAAPPPPPPADISPGERPAD